MNFGRIFTTYLFLLLFIQSCCCEKSGALFKLSTSGHRLVENIIDELNTYLMECCMYCLRKFPECKSVNYKTESNQRSSKNCQLINATKTTHPQNLVVDPSYNNYEPLTMPENKKIEEKEKKHYAKSCDDLYKSGKRTTGVYTIDPDNQGAFNVRCEMETIPGRGWTVFQRRVDGSVDFYRNWTDYKTGFGNLSGEFWLGLDKIHRLSTSGQDVLLVYLQSFEGQTVHAEYEDFSVGNESEAYILNVNPDYWGTAEDSLSYHKGKKFSTKDVDNDVSSDHCAQNWRGAWWFNDCCHSHLNGEYLHSRSGHFGVKGIFWGNSHSYKAAEMEVGPDLI